MDERLRETPIAFSAHIGMQMVDWSDGYARLEIHTQPHHLNRHGNPHGGVHASLLDTAMGFAGCWTGDPDHVQMCLTLSLNTQFLSRPKGTVFIGEGWKTGGGRNTFFAEAQVKDETGELLAKGTGVFRFRTGGTRA